MPPRELEVNIDESNSVSRSPVLLSLLRLHVCVTSYVQPASRPRHRARRRIVDLGDDPAHPPQDVLVARCIDRRRCDPAECVRTASVGELSARRRPPRDRASQRGLLQAGEWLVRELTIIFSAWASVAPRAQQLSTPTDDTSTASSPRTGRIWACSRRSWTVTPAGPTRTRRM